MSVTFEDHSDKVAAEIKRRLLNALEEGGALLESTAIQLTRVDTGKTKGAWGHIVDESGMEVSIGNTDENALWEEFGTGEYALEGNGRQGKWFVSPENLSAKWRARFPDGMWTHGKKPQRMLYTSFQRNKEKVKKHTAEILKGMGS
jgi:hypothetical protein